MVPLENIMKLAIQPAATQQLMRLLNLFLLKEMSKFKSNYFYKTTTKGTFFVSSPFRGRGVSDEAPRGAMPHCTAVGILLR